MNSNLNEVFGQRLKELRNSKEMRQEDVGAIFKMQKSTVSQWENGRLPHPSIIVKLADFFGVTTDYLLGRTGSPVPEITPATNHPTPRKNCPRTPKNLSTTSDATSSTNTASKMSKTA